jgi:pimeloyl-ACP methyl ester carboxylesterase
MHATTIFAHGAFISDSKWWWDPVRELLEKQGIPSISVDLPSCGEAPPLGDLHTDSAAVKEAIEDVDGPVILVGHSYGGAVITEAAVGQPRVRHLVYIAAIVPDGCSVISSDYVPPGAAPDLDFRPDGTVGDGLEMFKTRVLEGLPDAGLAQGAAQRLTRQAFVAFTQEPEGAAWREIPSTYILCQHDADVPVPQQRMQAARTQSLVEVPTNHFAHLERPDLISDVILGVAEKVHDEGATQVAG